MRHAGDFLDTVIAVELFVPGISVGMHSALEAAQMILGMRPAPVR
jgi:hypothetical protein